MADYQESKEATAHAVLGERNAPPTVGLGLNGRGAEFAMAVQKRITQETPRSALDALKNGTLFDKDAIGTGKIIDFKNKAFGGGDRAPGTPEKQREVVGTAALFKAQRLADGGYDAILKHDAATGSTNAEEVRKVVESAINRWQEGKVIFAAMTPAQRRSKIEEILRDPTFAPQMNELFAGVLKDESPLAEALKNARATLKTAKETKATIEDNKFTAEQALKQAKAKLAQFLPDPGTGAPRPGSRLHEYNSMNVTKLMDDKREYTAKKLDFEQQADRHLADSLAYKRAGRNADATTSANEYKTAQSAALEWDRRLKEINETLEQRAKFEADKAAAEAEEAVKAREVLKETNKLAGNLTDIKSAENIVAAREQDIAAVVDEKIAKAALAVLNERTKEAESEQEKVKADLESKAKDQEEANFAKEFKNRWRQEEVRRPKIGMFNRGAEIGFGKERLRHVSYDKKAIRNDFTLLISGGPDAVMRKMYAQANPSMTPAEIDKKFDPKKQDTFIANYRDQVVEDLMRNRIRIGGKLTKAELDHIETNMVDGWAKPIKDKANGNTIIQQRKAEIQPLLDEASEKKKKQLMRDLTQFMLTVLFTSTGTALSKPESAPAPAPAPETLPAAA